MLLQNSNAIETGGYAISNSLRFQSASSQYLNRTFVSPTDNKKWTLSFWFKRGALSSDTAMFSSGPSGSDFAFPCRINSSNNFTVVNYIGAYQVNLTSTAVLRDPSAWYHAVVVFDFANATSTNRVLVYLNGVALAMTGTYPATTDTSRWNSSGQEHRIGRSVSANTEYFDGCLTEVNFVDGQALTPSSFGETDLITGQWVAKKYTGSYGTNGFYLPFSNGTSTTTLGADSSGNSNNWTLNNFTRSAGVSDCWMTDVPSGNGGVSGTQPASNYCVFNPTTANTTNLINANLTRNGAVRTNVGSILLTSGKYYFETTIQDANGNGGVGVKQATAYPLEGYNTAAGATYFSNGEYKIEGAAQTSGFSSYTNGDVIGIAVDTTVSPAKIWFSKNNTWQGTGNPTTAGYSLTAGLDYYFAVLHGSGASSTTASANFGQRSFAYTPPTGFKALCTANLPAATIKKGNQYMDATLYTGTGATQSIVNSGSFSPDLVWLKKRGGGVSSQWHMLADTIRGTGATLSSNVTDAEYTGKTSVTAFNSNGFTLGADSTGASYYGWNISGDTYVGWQWDAGSSTVTNTNGSISSQVRANPTAGVSVVTLTTQSSGVGTYGHGLGVAPKMIIYKFRNVVGDWSTYHESLGNTKYIFLNTTGAAVTNSIWWNNTSPTSSVVTLGSAFAGSSNIVAYCFSEIAGFSKFGSYTGNGSADGPFVYLGFRPKFFMWKRTDVTANPGWTIVDSSRNTYNYVDLELVANSSAAESAGGASFNEDFLANGIKFRNTGAGANASGGTYIYAAFAENPFQNSNAR